MTDLLSPRTAAGVTVRPLSGHTGAEIGGIDIAAPLSPTDRATIADGLARWKVVFFRDQAIGHREQIAFARQFGDLTYAHPYDDDPPDGFPEIYTVARERYAQQYGIEGEAAKKLRRRYSYTNDWHTDVTAAVNPPAASVLRADVVPEFGGDTTFTNLVAAYEGLSDPVKRFVEGLRAEHRYGAASPARAPHRGQPRHRSPPVDRPPPGRPRPPETGEKALFVNPGFTATSSAFGPTRAGRARPALRRDHPDRSTPSGSTGSRAASRSGTTGSPPTSARRTSTTSTWPAPSTA